MFSANPPPDELQVLLDESGRTIVSQYVERPLTYEGRKLELRVLVLVEHGGVLDTESYGDDDDGDTHATAKVVLVEEPVIHVYSTPTVIKSSKSNYTAPGGTPRSKRASDEDGGGGGGGGGSHRDMSGHFTNVESHGAKVMQDDTLLRQAVRDAGGVYESLWKKIEDLAAKTVLAGVSSVIAAEELCHGKGGGEDGNPLTCRHTPLAFDIIIQQQGHPGSDFLSPAERLQPVLIEVNIAPGFSKASVDKVELAADLYGFMASDNSDPPPIYIYIYLRQLRIFYYFGVHSKTLVECPVFSNSMDGADTPNVEALEVAQSLLLSYFC